MNITEVERDYAARKTEAANLHHRAMRQAEEEGRALTTAELRSIEAKVNEARQLKARLDRAAGDGAMLQALEELTGGMGQATTRTGGPSLGTQFVSSATYQWLQNTRNTRGAQWTSEASELGIPTMFAATLDTTGGGGSPTVIAPQHLGLVPGVAVVPPVSELFAPGEASSNAIVFMTETGYTVAAAPVLEGGVKQESTLIFVQRTEPVRKIAHWIPVTEEMLEDVAASRSYIDARLRFGVARAEDDQLLNGNGTAPAVPGVLGRAGLAAAVPRGADTNADAVLKQMAAIETATGLRTDGVVMNPLNWQTIQLAKDLNGQYYGSGPFASPQAPTLWGRPVSLTNAIAAGTALVGSFRGGAQLFRRGGIRVEASNSHADFFTKNLVAVRAETRIGLAIYRESAFGVVTGLT